MAVVVVGPDRHQREPGAEREQEVEVLVAAPVVRHLEHVDVQVRQQLREPGLALGLDVAGEQQPHPAHLREQHHAGLVGGAAVTRADGG